MSSSNKLQGHNLIVITYRVETSILYDFKSKLEL